MGDTTGVVAELPAYATPRTGRPR
eukprot:SAG31_NODE_21555_length_546_cov_1.149888_1_plen_23_part_01